ncbi:MAG: hypothetical protein QM723_23850 [Myxococcaceae bacterium]
MQSLVFPSQEALEVALRGGLVPKDVQRAKVRVALRPGGKLELIPSVPLSPAAKKALHDTGVLEAESAGDLTELSCWAAALKPRPTDVSFQAPARVLFTLPSQELLLDLCAELFRLGCDRQEFRLVDSRHSQISALVRVNQPPWYVLSKALDHTEPLRAFLPTPPGQDQVWTELGYTHPLLTALEPIEGASMLVTREGDWLRVEDGEWTDVDKLVEPAQLPEAFALEASTPPRLKVHLKLTRASRGESPTLWVVKQGMAVTDALVRATPEPALEGLLFAVCGDTVLLRTRPGRENAAPALPGDSYSRLFELPNLFAPLGLTIEPPLRRERLRQWLASDTEKVSWLEPKGDGAFAKLTVAESAFRPLIEWVDYVIDGGEEELTGWVRSAAFDFADYSAREDSARPAGSEREEPEERARPKRTKERTDRAPAAPASSPRHREASLPASVPQAEVVLPPSELEAALAREEAAFLELEAPADSVERRDGWMRLGALYAQLSRHREAGLCFSHAVWEAEAEDARALAQRWAQSTRLELDQVLKAPNPSSDQTSVAVALLLSGALNGDGRLPSRQTQLVAWLDKYDEDLDVRSLWLGRLAVSTLSGGDPLALARARDRVLAKLTRGLSLERDVPRLLRVASQANAGGGTERVARVVRQLETILRAMDETPRKRSPVEAPLNLTRAYVGFEFAWAFARLGQAERARALRDAGIKALPLNHEVHGPVHRFLTRAYSVRIDQALEGLSPDTPLPAELTGQLNALDSFPRYRVDRLRQFSNVIETQERLDPISAFYKGKGDPRGEELAALRGLRDTNELVKALHARTSTAADPQLSPEERGRLLDALLDFLPQLPESSALPFLNQYVELAETLPAKFRVWVLEDALKVAGHFGRTPLVKRLVLALGSLVTELGAEGAAEVGQVLAAGLRSLRRVGLRQEAADLLTRVQTMVRGDDTRSLQTRLALAGGFAYLGSNTAAAPIFEEARSRLSREKDSVPDRLKLTRAAAQALSHLPTDQALPSLMDLTRQIVWITDSFNTNDLFCLSMIDFADSMVLGHVGDDLTLNEVTRRFIEEDEYLVRRRVHRDAGG